MFTVKQLLNCEIWNTKKIPIQSIMDWINKNKEGDSNIPINGV